MRATRLVMILAVIGGVLLPTVPARAGGGNWSFKGHESYTEPVFVWGEPVHAFTSLSLDIVKPKARAGAFRAGPKQGPFFGYLASRNIARWGPYPPPVPNDAIPVGTVVFTQTEDPRMLEASLTFTIPELEPGYYSLLHCNDPCTRQIGDTMSTPFTVVESRGQGLIADHLNHVERRLMLARIRLAERSDDLQGQIRRLRTAITSLEAKIGSLERDEANAVVPRSDGGAGPPVLLWVLLSGALAFGAGRFMARSFPLSKQHVLFSRTRRLG